MQPQKLIVKDTQTHTCSHTNTHTHQTFLCKLSLQYSLLYFHQSTSFYPFKTVKFMNSHITAEVRPIWCTHTQVDSHTHTSTHSQTVYWTLRVRADTPWCQSLSSRYLGPITIRVVVLFTFVFLAASASSS